MTRPDKFPEWGMTDVVENVIYNGETFTINNVIEPPAAKKATGWGYKDIAIRNWMNWLGRTTCQWLQYLDAPEARLVASLPDNAEYPVGKIIYVSDETGGAVLAFNDGTNWRRLTDRQIVS